MNHTVQADMLDEGQMDECKQVTKILKNKNTEADAHIMGIKVAIKKYTKDLGN